MKLDLAAIGNEPYNSGRTPEDIIIRNRRAAEYSRRVAYQRAERALAIRNRISLCCILLLFIICSAVCGVY